MPKNVSLTCLAQMKNLQIDALDDLLTCSCLDEQVRSKEQPNADKIARLLESAAQLYAIFR